MVVSNYVELFAVNFLAMFDVVAASHDSGSGPVNSHLH